MKDDIDLDQDIHISVEYAAGFIDADGCISCWENGSGNPNWKIMAVQSVKNGIEPLIGLKNRWGGSICRRATPKSKKHSVTYYWRAHGVDAAVAIQDMYPYLIIKKNKAQLALEYFVSVPKIKNVLARIGDAPP